MSKGRSIRCYDYVNHPYERVRDALTTDAVEVFRSATKVAASRAQSVAAELRVDVGGVELATDVAISVGVVDERRGTVPSRAVTKLEIEWEAARRPHLFPIMKAELSVYALTSTETQLDFEGRYEPPLGALGSALDAVAGHRIAEASVHRFVNDVARYLRDKLA